MSGRKADIRAFGKRPESGQKAEAKRPENGQKAGGFYIKLENKIEKGRSVSGKKAARKRKVIWTRTILMVLTENAL